MGLSQRIMKTEYLALLIIGVLTLLFTFPVGEGDFFWHVKTGQWIWEHRALPDRDPFDFPLQGYRFGADELPWVGFVLRQYWLGQLLLAAVWSLAGEAGMVILRAVAYGGILLFLLWWLRRKGIGIAELTVIFLTGNILRHYSAERPQLFAFMLLPPLLLLLETARQSTPRIPRAVVVGLPLTLLVWSNTHGSYVLALLIVGAYALVHLLTAARQHTPVSKGLLALLAGTVLASLANPCGWNAMAFSFNFLKMQASRTAEFASPWEMLLTHRIVDYPYWALVLAVILALLLNRRRTEPVQALVVGGLLLLSFKGTRYIPFFALTAPLLCFSLPTRRPAPRTLGLLLVLTGVWIATADYRNVGTFRVEKSFPVAAARFLETARPAGKLFNYVTWGGYLLCYTDYPVFVDTRNIVERFVAEHDRVMAGVGWQQILDSHDVQTIVIPGTDAISSQPYPLLFQLLLSPEWALVFMDDVALVLVRTNAANAPLIARSAINKSRMTEHIRARWQWQTANTL